MRNSKDRWPILTCVAGILVLFFAGVSLWSLGLFPAISQDEVTYAHLGHEFLKTGRIFISLGTGVIDPKYEFLMGAPNDASRWLYVGLLGVIQKIIGSYLTPLRFFSFFIWLLSGFLLFRLIKNLFGSGQALAGWVLWSLSLDALIASHMVRPEIIIGLFLLIVLNVALASKKKDRKETWGLIGLLCGLVMGFHPNGLILIAVSAFILVYQKNKKMNKKILAGTGLAGFLIGIFFILLFVDWPHYLASHNSYELSILNQRSTLWLRRANPLHLLTDASFNIFKPESYFVFPNQRHPYFWKLTGVVTFFTFCLFWFWSVFKPAKKGPLPLFYWGTALVFFMIGFGHIRPEYTYNIPITILMIPLITTLGATCLEVLRKQKSRFRMSLHLYVAALVLLWFLKTSFLGMLLFLIVVLVLDGASDRRVMWVGGVGLGVMLLLRVGNKSYFEFLNKETLAAFGNAPLLVGTGLILWVGLLVYRKKRKELKMVASPVLKLALLTLFTGFSSASVLTHQIWNGTRNADLAKTFQAAHHLIPDDGKRILGPDFFWPAFGDRFKATDAITIDMFYSGQKRAAECIQRFKPGYLIVGGEFRRRFLLARDKKTGEFYLNPVASVVPTSIRKIGVLEHNLHHGRLGVYALDW